MPNFTVGFASGPFESLDELALLACQDYNLGNSNDWSGAFRGGLYGFYARLFGIRRHYEEVHAWLPRLRYPTETEYQLTSILFHADSAVECLTFALNALGWAAMPRGFRDVGDGAALKRIAPADILGTSRDAPSGYAAVFPSLQTLWKGEAGLIGRITELHDVSKHREAIYEGGRGRLDVPLGFFETLGLSPTSDDRPENILRTLLCPAAEIILREDPKAPSVRRFSNPMPRRDLLEDLVSAFAIFVDSSGTAALADAQATVPLKVTQFSGGVRPSTRKMDQV